MKPRSLLPFALLGAACLPGDTRPEPAEIFVTAEPSDGTASGFVTDDGWTVTFDRFLTAIGDVDLDGPEGRDDDTCNGYSETRYEWLFDFTVAGREKVGLVFGLGTCSVEYRVRAPSDDTVLGPGASAQDAALMRLQASDAYVEDERVSLLVQGRAERDGVQKTFAWAFRRSHDISSCRDASGAPLTELELSGGDALEVRVVVRGEELFRREATDEAPLLFDALAGADADADGVITFEELDLIAAPISSEEPAPEEPVVESLADRMYETLLPRVTHVAGGRDCIAEPRD